MSRAMLNISTHKFTSLIPCSSAMDIVRAVECYVDKIVSSVSGLKVLLLDPDTVI